MQNRPETFFNVEDFVPELREIFFAPGGVAAELAESQPPAPSARRCESHEERQPSDDELRLGDAQRQLFHSGG
jgi:hypothetical protein